MTDHNAVYRRLLRRETHSPRSGVAVAVAALSALVLFALLGLGVWAVWDADLRSAASAWITDTAAGSSFAAVLTGAGAAAVVVAVLLLIVALAPGRRARRARMTRRIALVVDDGVLADATADAVARECALDRSQVSTTIARRSIAVRITPTSGVGVDQEGVIAAAIATLEGAGFNADASVDVSSRGVIA